MKAAEHILVVDDEQVGRLCRRIELDPEKPILIETGRGAGDIFTPPVEVL
ncbi:MAG TPA: hypothetical protein VN832_02315 [Stellaceae bacterium]|nr:hypothetical protein [Stellaceae bacterium]